MNKVHEIVGLITLVATVAACEVGDDERAYVDAGMDYHEVICVHQFRVSSVSRNLPNEIGRWHDSCVDRSCRFVQDEYDSGGYGGFSVSNARVHRNAFEYYGTCDDYDDGVELEPTGQEYRYRLDAPNDHLFETTVESTEGPAPVEPDAACTVEVGPPSSSRAPDAYNCEIEVRCGDLFIYGGPSGGMTHCSLNRVGLPQTVRANDEHDTDIDGDPIMSLDTVSGVATVSDVSRSESWSVRLRILDAE